MSNAQLIVPAKIHTSEDRCVLIVHWDKASGYLNYTLVRFDSNNEISLLTNNSPTCFSEEEINSLLAEMEKAFLFLSEMVEKKESYITCFEALKAFSTKITRQLFHEEFTENIFSSDRIKILQISSDEYWIPWDVLFCNSKKNFWGWLCTCARLPISPLGDNRHPIPYTQESIINRILNLIGPLDNAREIDLKKACDLFTWLSVEPSVDIISNNPLNEDYCELDRLSNRKFDISHFLGHCKNNALYGPCIYLGHSSSSHIYKENIQKLNLKDAVVISNACSSAIPFYHLRETISFAWEFSLSGVGVFVAPIAPITFDIAIAFSSYFFHFIIDDNLSAYIAFRNTKDIFLKNGDIRALFFMLCGYPDLRKTLLRRHTQIGE